MNQWEFNANYVHMTFGTQVDWEERFYICPECGEPIYDCDWTAEELKDNLCPVCGFDDDDDEEEGE